MKHKVGMVLGIVIGCAVVAAILWAVSVRRSSKLRVEFIDRQSLSLSREMAARIFFVGDGRYDLYTYHVPSSTWNRVSACSRVDPCNFDDVKDKMQEGDSVVVGNVWFEVYDCLLSENGKRSCEMQAIGRMDDK